MTYKEVMEFIEKADSLGSVLGLDNIADLMNELGDIQNKLSVIHIAGTNGKGSVGAFLSSVLKCSGYRIGRYISPAVISYNEKFQFNNENICNDELCLAAETVKSAVERLISFGKYHPTAFEIETAMAFLWFYKKNCDFVILETGLGGRLDATNIIKKNVLSVITSIGYDHMDFLGETLEEIAYEKCGIIKKRCPVVTAEQDSGVYGVIKSVCLEKNSELSSVDKSKIVLNSFQDYYQSFNYKSYRNVELKLLGIFQPENASLAIEAVEILRKNGVNISDENLYSGLFNTQWIGRFQVVMKTPLFIVDGAHNIDGAKRLRESVELYFKNRRIIFIAGIFKDKEYKKIAGQVADLAEYIYTVTLKNKRALDGKILADEFKKYNAGTEFVSSIETAVEKSILRAGKDGVVIAFGSLSYLAEIIEIIKRRD